MAKVHSLPADGQRVVLTLAHLLTDYGAVVNVILPWLRPSW